jgi:hypothetical protein
MWSRKENNYKDAIFFFSSAVFADVILFQSRSPSPAVLSGFLD